MKTLAKKDLVEVLRGWSDEFTIFAPVKRIQGDCILGDFDENAFTLDYGKPSLPPKSEFFPQSEVILEVKNGNYREVTSHDRRLLFGIRSCDLMGIRQSSSFMTRDTADPYYESRSGEAITVVMACPGPQNETCFCTTAKSGPFVEREFDLQFFDSVDEFIVEAGSKKGERLITGSLFADADESEVKAKVEKFKMKASESIQNVPNVKEAMNRLADGVVGDEVWDYFGRKCIICGGCAYVCPTCTCFNVFDRVSTPGEGLRVRSWDTCLFGGFTKEASGHNPRGTQALRLKRRHEHKLLYYNDADIQDGLCGCVGCGRCSDFCPVNIGTLEVVKAIVDGRGEK
jgi:sulfhydrogenase subunit beta (sulfur reductase)